MSEELKKYRCQMQTKPGCYAQYDGYVDIYCESDDWDNVFQAAVAKLKRTSFPDYSGSMWKMTRFEQLG